MSPNYAMNPPVLRVTALANSGKRRAARPAGYRGRYTTLIQRNDAERDMRRCHDGHF